MYGQRDFNRSNLYVRETNFLLNHFGTFNVANVITYPFLAYTYTHLGIAEII